MNPRVRLAFILPLLAACAAPDLALAKTLNVGPNEPYKQPSEAIEAAHDGDTVDIAPGEYFDCASVKANNLTIQGHGFDTVLTEKTCGGKGILITQGKNITVKNLTLEKARVADHNGAGIRAEGDNLTVDHVRFFNNENGILTNDAPNSTIRIINSEFERNGKCEGSCAHGLYAGHIGLLRVENSHFFNQRVGHHIKSRATRTELVGNTVEDGPDGTASYLVDIPNGGGLLAEGNTFEKGPNAENHSTAIVIGEEGVTQRTPAIRVVNNRFTNDLPVSTDFVHNLTATDAELSGNKISGKVRPLDGDGTVK